MCWPTATASSWSAPAEVEAVVAAAERKMATEGDMVRAIRAGEDPQAAYLRYRVF